MTAKARITLTQERREKGTGSLWVTAGRGLPVIMLSADKHAKAWISRFRLCKLKEKSLMESSHSPNPRRHWSRCRTSPLQNTNLSSAASDLQEKMCKGWENRDALNRSAQSVQRDSIITHRHPDSCGAAFRTQCGGMKLVQTPWWTRLCSWDEQLPSLSMLTSLESTSPGEAARLSCWITLGQDTEEHAHTDNVGEAQCTVSLFLRCSFARISPSFP